ncbi:hypothetical protein [Saliphagus sp. LR7]|uniref:hypothetical protein n=1 Tax=Saliphagus sp. LR7 TaxID=2282654 RepID=UPI000DF82E50|nr:hypothetical protein [Saliphagus sp. LR7]
MRRRYLLAVATVLFALLALLALGALPSLLGGGEVYYVTATSVESENGNGEPIRVENLSENRFPYTHQAIEEGISDAYEEGRFGIKESFTHTPSDEFGELRVREGAATPGDEEGVLVVENSSYYRLEITTDPGE